MPMELDDLKSAWRALDRRLDSDRALTVRVFQEQRLDRMRTALRRLGALVWYELGSGVLAALLVGSFLVAHYDTPRFAVPALVLHAAALFTIIASVRQLAFLGLIDYAAPVVELQRALARLRASRLRTTRWLLLLSPLLWTPLAIVAVQGLFAVDIYNAFGPAWVAWNLGVGLAIIPLGIWLARRYPERPDSPRWRRQLADALAGRSLATARERLDEIARFADER
jgi:hypothetical protein